MTMTHDVPEEPEDDDQAAEKKARRDRGEGSLFWSESRKRWIAEITTGFTPAGKRIVRRGSGKSKTEAQKKLKANMRDRDDGLAIAEHNYTVKDAVLYWFKKYKLSGVADGTIKKNLNLIDNHLIPAIGARTLKTLSVEEVEDWLEAKALILGDSSLSSLHSILNRSVKRAMARDKVKRNVVELSEIPKGLDGRPRKALNLEQAEAVLKAADGAALHAYVVLSILIGVRTEELRELAWDHVDLEGKAGPPVVPPSVRVWRSVRRNGETKTEKSRRTLAMPLRCVEALKAHKERQAAVQEKAGDRWEDRGLVFCTRTGGPLNVTNVLRDLRVIYKKAGLVPKEWTAQELRHTFVSLLSDSGVPIEHISRLVGHDGTRVTETVYRHQLRPALEEGTTAMDRLFPGANPEP